VCACVCDCVCVCVCVCVDHFCKRPDLKEAFVLLKAGSNFTSRIARFSASNEHASKNKRRQLTYTYSSGSTDTYPVSDRNPSMLAAGTDAAS